MATEKKTTTTVKKTTTTVKKTTTTVKKSSPKKLVSKKAASACFSRQPKAKKTPDSGPMTRKK